ncbi:hypothetical protein Tco_0776608 [Tanacetum coccineum]
MSKSKCDRDSRGADTSMRNNLRQHAKSYNYSPSQDKILKSNFLFSLTPQKHSVGETMAATARSLSFKVQNVTKVHGPQVDKAWQALSRLNLCSKDSNSDDKARWDNVIVIPDDDSSDDDVIFLADMDMFPSEEDQCKFTDKGLQDMLDAPRPTQATSKAKYPCTSNVKQTSLQSKGKQRKRTITNTIVVDKGEKVKRPPPIRDCVLCLPAVALYGKQRLQTRRRQRRDGKEPMV